MRRYAIALVVGLLIGVAPVLWSAFLDAQQWADTKYPKYPLSDGKQVYLAESGKWLLFQKALIDRGLNNALAAMLLSISIVQFADRRKAALDNE